MCLLRISDSVCHISALTMNLSDNSRSISELGPFISDSSSDISANHDLIPTQKNIEKEIIHLK